MHKAKTLRKEEDRREMVKRICVMLMLAILIEGLFMIAFPSRILLYQTDKFNTGMRYFDFEETSFVIPDTVALNTKEDVPLSIPVIASNYLTIEEANTIQIVGPHFYLFTGKATSFPKTKEELQSALDTLAPGANLSVSEDPVFDEVVKEWEKAITSVRISGYQISDTEIEMDGSGYASFIQKEDGSTGVLVVCSDNSPDQELANQRMIMAAEVAKSYRMELSDGQFIKRELTSLSRIQLMQDLLNVGVLGTVLVVVYKRMKKAQEERIDHK